MKKFIAMILAAGLLAGCAQTGATPEATPEPTPIATPEPTPSDADSASEPEPTPEKEATPVTNAFANIVIQQTPPAQSERIQEIVRDMGLGINLGNTLESCGDWISKTQGVSAYETAWGSPLITEEMIAGYAAAGFKSVRIPVAWSNLMGEDYTINAELMDRVQEIVNFVVNNGMYAIVNIHWDSGWWENFPTEKEECMERYTRFWTQISERFKDYDDHLWFESLNEEGGWQSLWNRYSGNIWGKDKSYGLLNEINQTFVDLVRQSGGNNANRPLLIAGYNTDIQLTVNNYFVVPEDPALKLAVSVHYYTPSDFAILAEDADWAKARATWGTDADIAELNTNMDMIKERFIDNGVPVILGEYGAVEDNKTPEQVRNFIVSVCEAAYTRGVCPMLWSTTGVFYDRATQTMYDPLLQEEFARVSKVER